MKHIGITIVVSLIVVVLISPLLRPKGESAPGGNHRTVSSEVRAAVTEYRDAMAELCRQTGKKYREGAVSMTELLYARLENDLAQLEFYALDVAGPGTGAARAAVRAHYFGELRKLLQSSGSGGEAAELIRVTRDECLARIELARLEPELSNGQAFAAARAAWENEPGPENLRKMFEAEFR